MPLTINVRQVEKKDLHLEGELPSADLDLANMDEMVELGEAIVYDLLAERLSDSILVQGQLYCRLKCCCVRCLREFTQDIELEHWTCDLPLEGEEKVAITNDSVDLTPYIREDIFLAFPQHPLCEPDCPGLLNQDHNSKKTATVEEQESGRSSAWAELNKLKF